MYLDPDSTLTDLLEQLSEETLFHLLLFIQRRSRRQSLRLQSDKDPEDLEALRALEPILRRAHEKRLKG